MYVHLRAKRWCKFLLGETENNDGSKEKKKMQWEKIKGCKMPARCVAFYDFAQRDKWSCCSEKEWKPLHSYRNVASILLEHRLCHTTLVAIINFQHTTPASEPERIQNRSTVQLFLVYRCQRLRYVVMELVTQLWYDERSTENYTAGELMPRQVR